MRARRRSEVPSARSSSGADAIAEHQSAAAVEGPVDTRDRARARGVEERCTQGGAWQLDGTSAFKPVAAAGPEARRSSGEVREFAAMREGDLQEDLKAVGRPRIKKGSRGDQSVHRAMHPQPIA